MKTKLFLFAIFYLALANYFSLSAKSTESIPQSAINDETHYGNPPENQSLRNEEDKNPDNYINNINRSANVNCQYSVELQYVNNSTAPQTVTELKQNAENRNLSNEHYRLFHVQFARWPIIDIESIEDTNMAKFTSFQPDSFSAPIRFLPYQQRLHLQGLMLEDAVESLSSDENIKAKADSFDEPIAYVCSGVCKNLANSAPSANCRQLRLSEIAYFFNVKKNQSTSYLQDESGIHSTPFPQSLLDLLKNKYQSITLAPDACYERLYTYLPIIPRGSMNTQTKVHNKNGDKTETSNYDRAINFAQATNNDQADISVNYLLSAQTKNIDTDYKFCTNVTNTSPTIDESQKITLAYLIKKLVALIVPPNSPPYKENITTEIVVAQKSVEVTQRDRTMLGSLIPMQYQEDHNLNDAPRSSRINENNIPDIGYSNELNREALAKFLLPASWPNPSSPTTSSTPL